MPVAGFASIRRRISFTYNYQPLPRTSISPVSAPLPIDLLRPAVKVGLSLQLNATRAWSYAQLTPVVDLLLKVFRQGTLNIYIIWLLPALPSVGLCPFVASQPFLQPNDRSSATPPNSDRRSTILRALVLPSSSCNDAFPMTTLVVESSFPNERGIDKLLSKSEICVRF
jgi:hypothetical protein